jgi:hypothetical protein
LNRESHLVPQAGKKDSGDGGAALETEDPCWQNFLDDDCQMSNIYSSSFIAADWIKSMPCGEGIKVSRQHYVPSIWTRFFLTNAVLPGL